MKTVFSLFFLLISLSTHALVGSKKSCHLTRETVSLSGPITMLLEELQLTQDPYLLAISKFHPIETIFTGEVLAGGLFLSKQVLAKFKNKLIFFDKSREFKKILQQSHLKDIIEIDTRHLSVMSSVKMTIEILRKYTKGCDQQLAKVESHLRGLTHLLNKRGITPSVFYLGRISNKLPELVIVNDGFVKDLTETANLKTYPSETSYVYWSKKIMNTLKNYHHFGVGEGGSNQVKIEPVGPRKFNLAMRGLLIPGIRQLHFLEQFLLIEKFQQKKLP